MRQRLAACLAFSTLLVSCGSLVTKRLASDEELPQSTRCLLAADLEKMVGSWDGMSRGKARSRREAEDLYESALAGFLKTWTRVQSPCHWRTGQVFHHESSEARYVVDLEPSEAFPQDVSPLVYDNLILPKPGLSDQSAPGAIRTGLGVPLVGRLENTPDVKERLPFLPPKGGNFTLTALMHIQEPDADGIRHCKLRLINTLDTDTVKSPVGERQLAADFTAPKNLALSRKAFGSISLRGLLYPEKAIGDCQLYRMDEYDPNRIPVVFVHGLMSDPHIWLNVVSDLCADPVLRKRYQPWYFIYPTAMGVPQAAAMLRKSLEAARDHFDPDHNDPGMSRMVLVGHSMGGLLSRMQVTDSGSKLWDGIFSKPPQEMNVSEKVRTSMTEALFVKPLSYVERVIFIATPHRGSKIASLNVVRRLTSLIRIPLDSLTMVNEILYGNMDALSPQITKWGVFSFISIGMLSDKHPLLQGLNETTPAADHHSIIGDRGRRVPREESSDGVVPYWSSHLSTAETEKMVPHGHGCVEEADVVREVLQLLHEHVDAR